MWCKNKIMTKVATVNGFDILTDHLYRVGGKIDKTAPSGFVEIGSSKFPQKDVGVDFAVAKFIPNPHDASKGVYDTGFYEDSPVYANLPKTEVKKIVANLKKHIVKPYEAKYGAGILDNKNIEFWDSYSYDLYEGKIIDTSNVDDLLGLYISLLGRFLTPIGEENNPLYKKSFFVIRDSSSIMKREEEVVKKEFEVIAKVNELLNSKKEKAKQLLVYLDVITPNTKMTDSRMMLALNRKLKDPNNIDYFYEIVQNVGDKAFDDKMFIYYKLKRGVETGKIVKIRNDYFINNIDLGKDLRKIAEALSARELEGELKEVYEKVINI